MYLFISLTVPIVSHDMIQVDGKSVFCALQHMPASPIDTHIHTLMYEYILVFLGRLQLCKSRTNVMVCWMAVLQVVNQVCGISSDCWHISHH